MIVGQLVKIPVRQLLHSKMRSRCLLNGKEVSCIEELSGQLGVHGFKDNNCSNQLPDAIERRLLQYHTSNNLVIGLADHLRASDDPTDFDRLVKNFERTLVNFVQ
ncbi:hypothetical protein [Chroococcidiopsis sp. CCMEE 29]|uniref:hypothetical protein n=1 Tax=Chroococcidiopsis sp. CCMEE 29 TaxID=155894 RepID=UPI0020208D17|nr:hypothetical protein [Chroococcidiopsis sp. CCMEE 29]